MNKLNLRNKHIFYENKHFWKTNNKNFLQAIFPILVLTPNYALHKKWKKGGCSFSTHKYKDGKQKRPLPQGQTVGLIALIPNPLRCRLHFVRYSAFRLQDTQPSSFLSEHHHHRFGKTIEKAPPAFAQFRES